MVHLVRTAFGDSSNTYGGDIWAIPLKPPPLGLGQGNGATPAIWNIIRSPLIKCLREAGHGAVFKCRISHDSFHLVGYSFVDDSTIIHVEPSSYTPLEDMVKLSQKVLNIFAEAAKATGGKIISEKTKWYLMDFKWDPEGKWRLADREATLTLPPQEGGKEIERLPPKQASRILVVWISPDGSYKEQTRRLHQITASWEDKVRSGHTKKQDA